MPDSFKPIKAEKIERIVWTFEKYGNLIRLNAKSEHWEQNRIFWFKTEKTQEQKEERMLKELDNLKEDLVERATFVFRARRGDFDDPAGGVEVDWRALL